MNILVCIRQGRDGEINPFDACAYEAALQIPDADITILSMGPEKTKDFLLGLTRLGAKRAILLTDKAFAGADTLATAYTLALAVKKINPDLIFCGRQTLEGDTAQVGPMLAVKTGYSLITNVLEIIGLGDSITCKTRYKETETAHLPALITVERINQLRRPSIRSRIGTVEVWSADSILADKNRCGLLGSPTRVIKTYENESGKRKCAFISPNELQSIVANSLHKKEIKIKTYGEKFDKLEKVFIVGSEPMSFAKTVSDDIKVLEKTDENTIAEIIKNERPCAVLWASDIWSKRTAAKVASMLDLGLCADCTMLESDGKKLIMYRPALSGSIIAKIESLTFPAMATVRTTDDNVTDIIVTAGYGVKDCLPKIKDFANKIGGELGTTRKAVDNNILPYDMQVGLTGKTVSPPIYIAIGVSGAVHHIVGMQRAGTVIAINPDRDAPIFEYADYGILANFEDVFEQL